MVGRGRAMFGQPSRSRRLVKGKRASCSRCETHVVGPGKDGLDEDAVELAVREDGASRNRVGAEAERDDAERPGEGNKAEVGAGLCTQEPSCGPESQREALEC